MSRLVLCLFSCSLLAPAWGSNPGEPLDCSDWVLLEPGLSCTDKIAYPCRSPFDPFFGVDALFCVNHGLPSTTTDNTGTLYRIHRGTAVDHGTGEILACGTDTSSNGWLRELQIRRWNGSSFEIVAYIQDRCVADANSPLGHRDTLSTPGTLGWDSDQLLFDEESGSLLLFLAPTCIAPDNSFCGNYTSGGRWMAAIGGFATTFEILQTYEPASSLIGFHVPYMPEGFQFADYFDTYYGDLATVGDWSQAQPLQCGYPATAPSVGDYLTVTDTLPTPTPGQGYYYVTAVNYQGQRRYGRKSSGGVLTGRDPAVLPGCEKQTQLVE